MIYGRMAAKTKAGNIDVAANPMREATMVGPAKRAYSYDLLIYGSEAGYLSSRAQIELHGPSTQDNIAWGRFCDPGGIRLIPITTGFARWICLLPCSKRV